MAEKKNTEFDRPGGYAQPKGATQIQRKAAKALTEADIRLYGDSVPSWTEVRGQKPEVSDRKPSRGRAAELNDDGPSRGKAAELNDADPSRGKAAALNDDDPSRGKAAELNDGNPSRGKAAPQMNESPQPADAAPPRVITEIKSTDQPNHHILKPAFHAADPDTRLYIGDCRDVLANLPEKASGGVDLVFADPPFNWEVPYDGWKDGMPRAEYERFTFDWLDGCIEALAPHGSIFVNIPDDTAAEAVLHLKRRGLTMINWCIWHFRFGQNRSSSFIMSKVHVLYFCKDPDKRIWNPDSILEVSDRASIYFDPRTMAKDSNKGLRVPMDVWYGKYWGRIQGNNKERRHNHHNQIPEIYLERVIKACSNMGGLVLDPFLGSGTTCTVARALGRRSIGIEYSKVNAESAWERITKVGMIPREIEGPQSTAIFKPRRKMRAAAASR